MLGTVDGLVIAFFTNHADMKFGAVAGAANIMPKLGVIYVA